MRIHLARKEDLTPEQLAAFDERLSHSEAIEGECGPVRAWRVYKTYLYAFLEEETGKPVAIAVGCGGPVCAPGWWIDPDFRGKGYGYEVVDLLVRQLKLSGVAQIGPILIQTPGGAYDEQSRKLVQKLREHFPARDG